MAHQDPTAPVAGRKLWGTRVVRAPPAHTTPQGDPTSPKGTNEPPTDSTVLNVVAHKEPTVFGVEMAERQNSVRAWSHLAEAVLDGQAKEVWKSKADEKNVATVVMVPQPVYQEVILVPVPMYPHQVQPGFYQSYAPSAAYQPHDPLPQNVMPPYQQVQSLPLPQNVMPPYQQVQSLPLPQQYNHQGVPMLQNQNPVERWAPPPYATQPPQTTVRPEPVLRPRPVPHNLYVNLLPGTFSNQLPQRRATPIVQTKDTAPVTPPPALARFADAFQSEPPQPN